MANNSKEKPAPANPRTYLIKISHMQFLRFFFQKTNKRLKINLILCNFCACPETRLCYDSRSDTNSMCQRILLLSGNEQNKRSS